MRATVGGDAKEVGRLTKIAQLRGMDPNQRDRNDWTPLLKAAFHGHLGLVKHLLRQSQDRSSSVASMGSLRSQSTGSGARPSFQQPSRMTSVARSEGAGGASESVTPLWLAAYKGHLHVVEYLAEEYPAQLLTACEGVTPFLTAVHEGHTDLVEYLVRQPEVDINETNSDGLSAIAIAAKKGWGRLVQMLLRFSVDVNDSRSGFTPLMYAAHGGCHTVCKILIEEGDADTKATTDDGKTALLLSLRKGHSSCFFLLLAAGVVLDSGMQELVIFEAVRRGHMRIVRGLISDGHVAANINVADGTTLVHIAAESGHTDLVRCLVNEFQLPIAKDTFGVAPIHVAARMGHLATVRWLLEHGSVPVDITSSAGNTALYEAARNGHADLVRYLVRTAKANTKLASTKGKVPIDVARLGGHKSCVDILRKAEPKWQVL